MVKLQRTVLCRSGKNSEAMQVAKKIAKYIPENYPGLTTTVFLPMGGVLNRIIFETSYPSLAELETSRSKLMADEKWLKLVAEITDVVVEGSIVDQFMISA